MLLPIEPELADHEVSRPPNTARSKDVMNKAVA